VFPLPSAKTGATCTRPRDLIASVATGSKLKRSLFRVARAVALVYAVVCLLVAGCQSKMLYFPTVLNEPAALAIAERDGLEPWRDAAGGIIGWKRVNPRAAARLLVFHGNGGCALDRVYYADSFGALDGGATWEVFVFEYPGYGARAGSPGRDAFIASGRAALDALLAADQRPLFLLGESIGSGTAAALAGSAPDRVAGAVMMIPFARLVEVAKAQFPLLPVSLLLRDKFDNIAALETYKRPVAVVLAENDEIIGAEQGRKLYDAYAGPKKLIVLPGASHNDFPHGPAAEWVREVSAFLRAPR
jgi:uncharacterized protein